MTFYNNMMKNNYKGALLLGLSLLTFLCFLVLILTSSGDAPCEVKAVNSNLLVPELLDKRPNDKYLEVLTINGELIKYVNKDIIKEKEIRCTVRFKDRTSDTDNVVDLYTFDPKKLIPILEGQYAPTGLKKRRWHDSTGNFEEKTLYCAGVKLSARKNYTDLK